MGTPNLVLWYHTGDSFDLVGYTNLDYVGYLVYRKSTSRIAHLLGHYLVSWAAKKQNSLALSIVEVECVTIVLCFSQLLWLKQQLSDYRINMGCIPIMCDNPNAVNIAKKTS